MTSIVYLKIQHPPAHLFGHRGHHRGPMGKHHLISDPFLDLVDKPRSKVRQQLRVRMRRLMLNYMASSYL
jgi:hypothetical protein